MKALDVQVVLDILSVLLLQLNLKRLQAILMNCARKLRTSPGRQLGRRHTDEGGRTRCTVPAEHAAFNDRTNLGESGVHLILRDARWEVLDVQVVARRGLGFVVLGLVFALVRLPDPAGTLAAPIVPAIAPPRVALAPTLATCCGVVVGWLDAPTVLAIKGINGTAGSSDGGKLDEAIALAWIRTVCRRRISVQDRTDDCAMLGEDLLQSGLVDRLREIPYKDVAVRQRGIPSARARVVVCELHQPTSLTVHLLDCALGLCYCGELDQSIGRITLLRNEARLDLAMGAEQCQETILGDTLRETTNKDVAVVHMLVALALALAKTFASTLVCIIVGELHNPTGLAIHCHNGSCCRRHRGELDEAEGAATLVHH
mmetsp:Transcript_109617/g.283333  ORF Transcript_109617/g.283333 Transcript_109617/m.283333 type:complete len:372 (+) Transcript_109617:894-2009(+)